MEPIAERKNMAAYIKMIKELEDDKKVVYRFGPNDNQMGLIEFDKQEKEFKVLKHVNDSVHSNETYERWAAIQIVRLMITHKGRFPDVTSVEK